MFNQDISSQIGYRLLVRPRPIKYESSLGYLSRVASSNAIDINQLLRLVSSNTLFGHWKHLHERLCLQTSDTARLIGPIPQSWQVTSVLKGIALVEFNHLNVRWCPLCLNAKPYLRGEWGLKLSCVCEIHGCCLQERCTQCGQIQSWHHLNLPQCSHCGTALDKAITQLATQEVVVLQKSISATLIKKRAKFFPGLDINAWLRLMRYLGQFVEAEQPRRPGQIAGLHQLEVAKYCVQNAAHLLVDWPHHFEHLLEAIQLSRPATPSLKKTFGALYRVLYFHLRDEHFQFLRDAFESYLHQHWWGMVCKRNRLFKDTTIAKHPRLTLKQVATHTGLDPALIRQLSETEFLSKQAMTLPSGRQARSFHQADLPHIQAIAKDVMDLQTTAKYLAVSERVVRELISVEIVKPLALRDVLKASRWLISKQSLEVLVFRVTMSNDKNLIPLSSIIQYWRLREDELVQLILAIQENAFTLFGASNQSVVLGKVMLDKAGTKCWLNKWRKNKSNVLSVNDVAQALGIKQQVAYHLVNIGLIKSKQSKQAGKQITTEALSVFEAKYVSLSVLAKGKKTSPAALLKVLKVKPITGPQVDGGRQYFYLRKHQ